jgi:4-hydroxy-tetrahydrodipicolinate reductase
MTPIRVVVAGARGKMGLATVKAVLAAPDMALVGALTGNLPAKPVDVSTLVGFPPSGLLLGADWDAVLPQADVCVDFTHPDAVWANTQHMLRHGVRPVLGTTGLTPDQLQQLHTQLSDQQLGGLMVPNFSIGAVLMMRFAQQAARYFEHAEIVEIHHNRKADAPSGTAIKTAELMAQGQPDGFGRDNGPETELLPGARGAEGAGGVRIHSVRLPGMVAHQEVMLTSPGQLLTLRHDSFDRACYMPGVLLAIRHAMTTTGLTYGLETLL